MNTILLSIGLPISCAVYLTLYTPNVRDVITGTESNFQTSGGFGPNQAATFRFRDVYLFFSYYLESKNEDSASLIVALIISFRGIVTFS
jgi:hypothetical protein